jgi:hypothetical protein
VGLVKPEGEIEEKRREGDKKDSLFFSPPLLVSSTPLLVAGWVR